jgi:serine/threonine-protein kinase HipA
MRKAVIYINAQPAGFLTEDEEGYHFEYSKEYVSQPDPRSGLQGWGDDFWPSR